MSGDCEQEKSGREVSVRRGHTMADGICNGCVAEDVEWVTIIKTRSQEVRLCKECLKSLKSQIRSLS